MSCYRGFTKTLQSFPFSREKNSTVAASGSHVCHFCKLAAGGTALGYYNRQTPLLRSYSTTLKSSVSKSSARARLSRLQARHLGVRRGFHGAATLQGIQIRAASSTEHQETHNITELQDGGSGTASSTGTRSTEDSSSKVRVPSQGPKRAGKVIVDHSRNSRSAGASANTMKGSAKKNVFLKSYDGRQGHSRTLIKKPAPASGAVESERETWQVQKSALSEKFGSSGWSPRKRLSPDSLEGIRALHAQYPDKFTTSVLADQFKVSPEAVRRILKSKWRPNEKEEEERRERWNKRGMTIWAQMNELGVKPPRKWRDQGVGKSEEQSSAREQRLQHDQAARKGVEKESYSGRLPAKSTVGREIAHTAPLADRIL